MKVFMVQDKPVSAMEQLQESAIKLKKDKTDKIEGVKGQTLKLTDKFAFDSSEKPAITKALSKIWSTDVYEDMPLQFGDEEETKFLKFNIGRLVGSVKAGQHLLESITVAPIDSLSASDLQKVLKIATKPFVAKALPGDSAADRRKMSSASKTGAGRGTSF